MTILFLSRLFYPHIGGVEKHVLEIGRRLIKNGYKVIVITEVLNEGRQEYHSKRSSANLTGEIQGIEVYRIPVGRENWFFDKLRIKFKKFRIWWWFWKHRDLIRNADVVHCHDVFFWYLPFRFLYPQKPVYITFHGYETKYSPSKKAILQRRISEELSFGNICVGDYIKKWYGTKPTFVTYGGIEQVQSSKFKVQSYSSKFKILFIGRLDEDTGIPIYIKALQLLKNRGVKFEFEACGDGSFRKEAEKFGKVHGFVSSLDQYIKSSDFVFSSSYLSILEAIAAKRLVFSVYDNLLKRDYLKMSPFEKWIVIEDSSESVVERIEYFIQHQEERDKTVGKAYEWVRTQTWEKVANLYLKLWKL